MTESMVHVSAASIPLASCSRKPNGNTGAMSGFETLRPNRADDIR